MGTEGRRHKHAFLQFEIKALRELPGKLRWMGIWLVFELLLAVLIVMSCSG